MRTAEKIAKITGDSGRTEYLRHLCGSVAAARSNLAAAANLLEKMYPEETYADASKRLSEILEGFELDISGVQDCTQAGIRLHTQSAGNTPMDFPNQIYRFTQREDSDRE